MNIIRKTTPWFPSLFDEFFTRDFGIDLAPRTYQKPAVNITEKEDAFHLKLVADKKINIVKRKVEKPNYRFLFC